MLNRTGFGDRRCCPTAKIQQRGDKAGYGRLNHREPLRRQASPRPLAPGLTQNLGKGRVMHGSAEVRFFFHDSL